MDSSLPSAGYTILPYQYAGCGSWGQRKVGRGGRERTDGFIDLIIREAGGQRQHTQDKINIFCADERSVLYRLSVITTDCGESFRLSWYDQNVKELTNLLKTRFVEQVEGIVKHTHTHTHTHTKQKPHHLNVNDFVLKYFLDFMFCVSLVTITVQALL